MGAEMHAEIVQAVGGFPARGAGVPRSGRVDSLLVLREPAPVWEGRPAAVTDVRLGPRVARLVRLESWLCFE